jgi:hypothetical protein
LQEINVTQEGNIRIEPIKSFDDAGTSNPILGC